MNSFRKLLSKIRANQSELLRELYDIDVSEDLMMVVMIRIFDERIFFKCMSTFP